MGKFVDMRLDIWKKCLLRKSGDALTQAAQGGGGVDHQGGVPDTCRCGTEGQWAWVGLG